METDLIKKIIETKKNKPNEATYSYPFSKFQIPELPLLSDVEDLPEDLKTNLLILKCLNFNLVYDRDNNKWVFQENGSVSGGGSALKTPTMLNVSVEASTWTKIATLPNNVGNWTLKAQTNTIAFSLNFDGGTNALSLPAGAIYSEDTNPNEIWVYHTESSAQTFELLYWTA